MTTTAKFGKSDRMKSTYLIALLAFTAPALAQLPGDIKSDRGPDVPGFKVRPGYRVTRVVPNKALRGARFIQFSEDGKTLFVSDMESGVIYALRDLDENGMYKTITTFVKNKRSVHGMDARDGWLYFSQANEGSVSRARDTNNDGVADEVETIIPKDTLPVGGGHPFEGLLITDKEIYVTSSDPANMTEDPESDRKRIYVFDRDGKNKRTFVTGVRNVEKLRFRPGTVEIWGFDHGSDNFGKSFGEATIIATGSDGSVVYGANVRVSQNISSINDVLHTAMPDSNITVTSVGQMAVINGTVASPQDAAQAEMLVRTILNPGIKDTEGLKILPVNRLKVATPLQVTLKVRIAEVNRSLLKNIGVNLFSSDPTSGFKFGIGQGSAGATSGPTSSPFSVGALATGGTTLGAAGKLLGLDISGAIDLAQKDGVATILAEPNLTALSGETASFLAGGEYPIPISQSLGAVSIEYKQYGVGLAFTPIVLADGRISMRVRPEVSELSDAGSIKIGDVQVPALITRRAETTVELGSGQSLMIAGLLRNSTSNNINKAPFLGDIPILGMLFRSTAWKREESELVIIVTPYLVRPVSNQLATPSDGYRAPDDGQETFLGQTYKGASGVRQPTAVPAAAAPAPGFKL